MKAIRLCRYDSNANLEEGLVDIDLVEYLAISHVWATATWRNDIPGIPKDVLVSDHKATFLQEQLPKLTADDWFWMDVLCVDQKSEQARIDVVSDIPRIYSHAKETIVIREPGGISECCADAVGKFESWNKVGAARLASHISSSHKNGLIETWFNRLWPLQEMLLSDRIVFAACRDEQFVVPAVDVYDNHVSFRRISDSIYCTAQAWVTYGIEDQGDEWEYNMFINAMFSNGFVARRSVDVNRQRPRALINDLAIHCNSLRVTSKARDFILAILPQYGWYSPPVDVRRHSFGQLWVDCYQQAVGAGFGFYPTITRGMTGERPGSVESRNVTEDIPEPRYLGDFIKMVGCTFSSEPSAWGTFVADVLVEQVDVNNMEVCLEAIQRSMDFCKAEWQMAHRGDLSQYGMFPFDDNILDLQIKIMRRREEKLDEMSEDVKATFSDRKRHIELQLQERLSSDYHEVESIKILNAMWAGLYEDDKMAATDWRELRCELMEKDAKLFTPHLLLLAAVVSCNLGLSSVKWCRERGLSPVVTSVGPYRMLLLTTMTLPTFTATQLCVQRGSQGVSGRDLFLVDPSTGSVVGKFPDFSCKTIDVDDNIVRLQQMYPEVRMLAYDIAEDPRMERSGGEGSEQGESQPLSP